MENHPSHCTLSHLGVPFTVTILAKWMTVHPELYAKSIRRTVFIYLLYFYDWYFIGYSENHPTSILAWKIPWTEKPGRVQSTRWQSRTDGARASWWWHRHFSIEKYPACILPLISQGPQTQHIHRYSLFPNLLKFMTCVFFRSVVIFIPHKIQKS